MTTERDEQRWSQEMAAAHRGDARSYERLLRELGTVIERYVRRRFGQLQFVEDCVQECLLAIHSGRSTYDPSRPFRPWFFTIVRHKTIDFLRRSYGDDRPKIASDGGSDQPLAPDPAAELATAEVLRRLSTPHRDAIELTKIIGYSTSEAAARVGISEAAMRARISRALRATARLMRDDWSDS